MDAAARAHVFLSLFIFATSIVCSSAAMFPFPAYFMRNQHLQTKAFHYSHRRGLVVIPPEFTVPTDTGPVTLPPAAPATIPPATPSTPAVTNPVTTPSTGIPGGPPVTTPGTGIPGGQPVTTPGTGIPGGQPMTTPSTPPDPMGGFPGSTTPAVGPPTATNPPAGSGQSYCVAKNGVPETTIQVALDYACGIGGADCSAIQQGASCYNPNTLQNHASFAFNSYYQKNPSPTSCDFGGAATLTNANPSTGSCIFSTSPSSPTTTSPTTPTPTPMLPSSPPADQPATTSPTAMMPPPTPTDPTTSPTAMMPPPTPPTSSSIGSTPTGSGIPPNILNASSPDMGGAPAGLGSSGATSASLQPFTTCVIAAISMVTGRIIIKNI